MYNPEFGKYYKFVDGKVVDTSTKNPISTPDFPNPIKGGSKS
jgi:hypothetical protein